MGRGESVLEALLYTIPLGLTLDIVGFLLIIRYGHSLFIRSGSGPPDDSIGKDGDLFLQHRGPDKGQDRLRRFWAYVGVATVIAGFGLQIVGSMAAICLSK